MKEARINIRCDEDCEFDFKFLCLTEKKSYGEFLKDLVANYKQSKSIVINKITVKEESENGRCKVD